MNFWEGNFHFVFISTGVCTLKGAEQTAGVGGGESNQEVLKIKMKGKKIQFLKSSFLINFDNSGGRGREDCLPM